MSCTEPDFVFKPNILFIYIYFVNVDETGHKDGRYASNALCVCENFDLN